jgi:hypothetical protein
MLEYKPFRPEQLTEGTIHERNVDAIFRFRSKTQPAHESTDSEHRKKKTNVGVARPLY